MTSPPFRIAAPGLLLATLAPSQAPDWHRAPALTSLATKRLGYDPDRERLILFESSERGAVSRTWEWVDHSWSLRSPGTTPTPRQGFAAGYDPVRGRFVVFGGGGNYYYAQAPNGVLADTWEYDGIDWMQRTPTASPPPQYGGWLGYDHAAGKLLLCAGVVSTSPAAAWHYDGTTWTAATAAPFLRSQAALASDPIRARIVAVVHQPVAPGTAISATMEWNGTSWQTLATPQAPPPRIDGAMTFAPSRGTVVLHGGYSGTGSSLVYHRDLWEWDGANWSVLTTTPAPARAQHELAQDARSGELVLVGGFVAGNAGTETRYWNGASWDTADTTLGWETFANAAFDPIRGTVVVINGNGPIRGLEWDGTHWSTIVLPPSMSSCNGYAYDVQRSRLVTVGRITGTTSMATWERTGTTWSAPTPSPTLAATSRLVWHGGRGRVLATCGTAGLEEWDGTQWTAVPNASGAPCSFDAPVYDAARNELVVPRYSGTTLQVDVWDGAAWSVRVPTTSPPLRHSYAHLTFGYDDARQRVVLFGGRSPSIGTTQWNYFQFLDDLWEWDGTDWSLRTLSTSPPAREAAALVFDPVRQQLLLLGGERQESNGALLLFSDVWALDWTAPADLTVLGSGCASPAGQPRLVAASPHPGATAFTIDLQAAPATAPGLFLFGAPAAPVALGAGCTSFVPVPQQILFTVTNAGGFASARAKIPQGLLGFSFAAQAAVLDAAAPLGFAVTQGLQVTVGH